MKRLGLMTVLLLGSVLSAQADNDVYYNTLKHPRSDDALQADTETCNEQFGAPDNGTVTSQAYKRCMLGHGWKFSHTERQSARAPGETANIPIPIIPA